MITQADRLHAPGTVRLWVIDVNVIDQSTSIPCRVGNYPHKIKKFPSLALNLKILINMC